jgi:hypothetical protein
MTDLLEVRDLPEHWTGAAFVLGEEMPRISVRYAAITATSRSRSQRRSLTEQGFMEELTRAVTFGMVYAIRVASERMEDQA